MTDEQIKAFHLEHPPLSSAEQAANARGLEIATGILSFALPIGGAALGMKVLNSGKAVRGMNISTTNISTLVGGQKVAHFSIVKGATPENARTKLLQLNEEHAARFTKLHANVLPSHPRPAELRKAELALSRELLNARQQIDDQLLITGHTVGNYKTGEITKLSWDQWVPKWMASIQNTAPVKGQPLNQELIMSSTASRYTSGVTPENIDHRVAAAQNIANNAKSAYLDLSAKLDKAKESLRRSPSPQNTSEKVALEKRVEETGAIMEGAQNALEQLIPQKLRIDRANGAGPTYLSNVLNFFN